MNSKTKLLALSMISLFAGESSCLDNPSTPKVLSEEEKRINKEIDNKKKGLKKFIIEGKEIWAINQKVAEKKYSKIILKNN